MTKWIERKPISDINKGTDLLSRLCNIRGISKDDVGDFLTPDRSVLLPASTLKNGYEGAERIKRAIDNDEKILISMDNDADGVTSTAIIIRYLRERIALVNGVEADNDGNVQLVIPYIFAERDWGHGIKAQLKTKSDEPENDERNENARHNLNKVKEADLLIIVDSSSNDVDTCNTIVNEYGTDVVILDHHEIDKCDRTMEDVGVILVNPQQRGCRYINKSISGAVVVYKIMELVEELYGDGLIDVEQYIDLAGIGIDICANMSFPTI